MGLLYLGGPTIQEVDGEMMMGLSIYGVAVMDGSLYSRFYGIAFEGTFVWMRPLTQELHMWCPQCRPRGRWSMWEPAQHNPMFSFSSSNWTAFRCVTAGGATFSTYSSREE